MFTNILAMFFKNINMKIGGSFVPFLIVTFDYQRLIGLQIPTNKYPFSFSFHLVLILIFLTFGFPLSFSSQIFFIFFSFIFSNKGYRT